MLIKDYTPVTEAYFGKSKELIEVEKLVEVIIKKFTVPFKNIGKRIIDAPKVNKSKENRKIEELLCKQFGFKEMVLHWDGGPTVNAFTVTHGLLKLMDSSEPTLPIKNSDGGYYDSKHMYICVVNFYAGFIDIKLTAEEVVACILHEIGHNFVCTPVVNFVSVLEWAALPLNIYRMSVHMGRMLNSVNVMGSGSASQKEITAAFITLIKSAFRYSAYLDMASYGIFRVFYNYTAPESVKQYLAKFDKYIDDNKNKILAEWEEYVEKVNKMKEQYKQNPNYFDWVRMLSSVGDIASFVLNGGFLFVQNQAMLLSGYSNEVFADSFATAYGYGPATVSLQRKIDIYVMKNRALAKENKYNVYNQYIYVMSQITQTFVDEHPAQQTRMRKQIDKLRAELEDESVDPRIRKSMLRDLDRAEKIYNDYIEKFPPELRHLAVIMNFNQLNEMYFGGKLDLREPINRVLNAGKSEA